ncbi:ImmA/IrrE family metallo-endopeptidase [Bacillaceae bacterium IKA-2]|nr:ImmA/IrrE family metallo-endopeptidase [Bacillaceae bacterium IKA-2]
MQYMLYHNYTGEQLESRAMKILTEYNASLLNEAKEMDVYHFAEYHLKLSTDYKNISSDKSILGLTCFNDGYLEVWDDNRENAYFIEVSKGTIIIDNDVLENQVPGRERFTVIHECAHQILHSRFYQGSTTGNSSIVKCAKRDIEPIVYQKPMTPKERHESQANRLGAALIMPAAATKTLLLALLNMNSTEIGFPVYISGQLICEMAGVFNVSNEALKIRLTQLGLIH